MTITEEIDLTSLRDTLLTLQQELNTLRGGMATAQQSYNNSSWLDPNRKRLPKLFSTYSQQYKEKKAVYDQLLSEYNQKVALYNQGASPESSITGSTPVTKSVAAPTPVEAESPAVEAVAIEVPDTKGTIQEVVSKPRPKLAPTIVISDDKEELEDNLELNDVLIDDGLELNDTPVVGVGDAGVSYKGTVYRMPKEIASTVDLIKQSGGTGTLHKRVKYQGEDGSKALIRKGNWRKNQYKVTEKDGSSYTTDDLQKFLQHLAAIEETAES